MNLRHILSALPVLAMMAIAGGALAAPERSGEIKDKKADLKEVQSRIRDLQKDIAKTEESRAEASDDLQEAEESISETSRRLHELSGQRGALERELARLAARSAALEKRIQSQQVQLEQLLGRYYTSGQAQGLQHLLSGSDPNQLARDLHYLKLLSQAESDLISQLTTNLAEQKKLTEEMSAKRDALAANEKARQKELAQLAAERKKHKTLVDKLGNKIRDQRREVSNLKRDEQRLSKLIDGLAKLALERAKKAAAPKKADTKPGATGNAPVARVDETPEPIPGGGQFEMLRGRLRLPVTG